MPVCLVCQPSTLMGRAAVELLLEEALDPTLPPRQVAFQPELILRASTADGK